MKLKEFILIIVEMITNIRWLVFKPITQIERKYIMKYIIPIIALGLTNIATLAIVKKNDNKMNDRICEVNDKIETETTNRIKDIDQLDTDIVDISRSISKQRKLIDKNYDDVMNKITLMSENQSKINTDLENKIDVVNSNVISQLGSVSNGLNGVLSGIGQSPAQITLGPAPPDIEETRPVAQKSKAKAKVKSEVIEEIESVEPATNTDDVINMTPPVKNEDNKVSQMPSKKKKK